MYCRVLKEKRQSECFKWPGGRGDEHCFWKQVHFLSPVTLIGLVNREEEKEREMVRYHEFAHALG